MKPAIEIPGYRRVYKAVQTFGPNGATAYEVGNMLEGVNPSSITSRINELTRQQYIARIGTTSDPARMGTGHHLSVDVYAALERS